jgi:hypothetical protein
MTDTPATGEAGSGTERERLDAAADAWLDGLKAAFDIVRNAEGVPRGDTDVAEGYRWVTRLSRLALYWFVEYADPLHPKMFLLQDEDRKLLVDNPDVRYLFSVLDDTRSYRLTGSRGEAAYVGFTFGTPMGKGAVNGRTGTLIQTHLDEFELGPDGEVDILIVPPGAVLDPRPANVIEMVPGTAQIAVRETFFDKRRDRPAELNIELVGDVPPPVLTADEMVPQLEWVGLFVQFVAATAVNMWHDTAQNVNRFGGVAGSAHVEAQEDEVRSHSNAEMTYHGGRFVLGEDEALVVTVHQPDKPFLYWGLTTASPWMESYDYRYTTTNLNNKTAERSADGSWRLVIAPSDPGVPNWLDSGGRREGYMLVRWVLADGPPHPSAEVVKIADLTR